MGRLVASEFLTLDGVIEAPGHDEHRDGKNAWALQGATEDQQHFKIEELLSAEALLLGRVTYQIFAAFWPSAPRDEGFADKMNAMRKYVVSTTLRTAEWNNTVVINGEVAERVSRIKQETVGDIMLHGSADLFNALLGEGLVDELRMMVFPIRLGSGKRLFREAADIQHFQLVSTRSFASGVAVLTYEPATEGPTSAYTERFAWTDDQIRSYQAAQNADRVLASVLFTDLVGSTARAADLGDRRWHQILDRHDEIARATVEQFRGRLVKTTGDGILATFDAPTRALRCAFSLQTALADLGLASRAAVHTGEIEIRADDVGGIGVHIAARALAEAREGQVIVTRMVRDLATGVDLVFAPLGSVGLRGVPGEWELFDVSST
ncbi:MAG TPA: dihydrofolate reductase family protein [Actinomycetota bacterium]|nr:dihydrofolate reductase family protein [Actinomycetota bacterium]